MKLYLFPPSSRALAIVALKNHLGSRLRAQADRSRPRRPAHARVSRAQSQPEDADAPGRRIRALGVERHPVLPGGQAARERALAFGSARPGRCAALARLGERALGCRILRHGRLREIVEGGARPWRTADPAFIARGEQNFLRFAAVLDDHLKARAWVTGERLTIADFSIGAFVPTALAPGAAAGALRRNRSLVRRPGRTARMAGCRRRQGRSHGRLARERTWRPEVDAPCPFAMEG